MSRPEATTSRMRAFWDERAAEDAFYFVDNGQRYRRRDEQSFWSRGQEELERLMSATGTSIAPTDDVVEIGCGVGRMTHLLAARARSVRAVDVSPHMLDLARTYWQGLDNVTWVLGDGTSLAGIEAASADAFVSHVVFQHIPDPQVTLGYVREIGRVLRGGGWAAFQVSNDTVIHRRRTGLEGLRIAVQAALGRGPRGQADPCWLGSAIELDDLRRTADHAGMDVEQVAGEGTQLCFVRIRRRT